MGVRADRIEELEWQTRDIVVQRDGGKCRRCGVRGGEVHEVVSRSAWGSKKLDICFDPKNRVLLCPDCHTEVQGQRKESGKLLRGLKEQFGYEYRDRRFLRCLRAVK